jgi:hypothetical protein
MKRLARALVFAALAVGFVDTQGCTSACIRHTDCSSGEECITGSCIVVAVADGSTAGSMTPPPSSTAMPTATSTSPAPSSSAPGQGTPTDAGTTVPPFPLDATFDGYTF